MKEEVTAKQAAALLTTECNALVTENHIDTLVKNKKLTDLRVNKPGAKKHTKYFYRDDVLALAKGGYKPPAPRTKRPKPEPVQEAFPIKVTDGATYRRFTRVMTCVEATDVKVDRIEEEQKRQRAMLVLLMAAANVVLPTEELPASGTPS